MKNMFKVSLVAAALAGVCSTAYAARIDVAGGNWDRTGTAAGAHQVFTASTEWLSVNSKAEFDGVGERFHIVLEDQYSVDDKVLLTFTGTSIDFDSLPLSRTGIIGNGSVATPYRSVITLGRIGSTVVNGNTVVEYRVTNVSEGANTVGAVVYFGANPVISANNPAATDGDPTADPVVPAVPLNSVSFTAPTKDITFSAAGVLASNGVKLTVQSFYKNNGAEFDRASIRRTAVDLIAVGNQLDGMYTGNLTARIETFGDGEAVNSLEARQRFVNDSGIGRALTRTATDGSAEFANKATVNPTRVSSDFAFQQSFLKTATGANINWNFGLVKANVRTDVTLNGDFSWFVRRNSTTNDPELAFGGDIAEGGANWGSDCAAAPAPAVPATPTALKIRCAADWDFDFYLDVTNLADPVTKVIPKQTFTADVTMTYSGDLGASAARTKSLTQNVGTWTNDGTSVFIPYMPYGQGISQLLFVTNTGPIAREVAVDVYVQNHNLSGVSNTFKGFTDVTPLNVKLDVKPGITNISAEIAQAMVDAGVWTWGRNQSFAFDLIVAGDEKEITVYSGYNVNQDRNLVINTSNQGDKVTDHNIPRGTP